jgi:hypothetical protein
MYSSGIVFSKIYSLHDFDLLSKFMAFYLDNTGLFAKQFPIKTDNYGQI